MADEPITSVNKGPEPTISLEDLKESLSGTIKAALAEGFTHADPYAEGRRREPEPVTRGTEPSNPILDLVAPHLAPVFQRLGLVASSAEDAALFYSTHPEAVEFRGHVEEATQAMHKQGIPMAREAIWDWYKGKNEDLFAERRAKKAEADERRARQESGVEAGAANLSPEVAALAGREAHSLTDEELDLVLKGKGGAVPASF